MIEFEFTVPASHASLAGHFPGNPVVPGVVILDQVVKGFRQETQLGINNFPSVKFVQPLKPEQVVVVCIEEKKPGLYQFRCEHNQAVIASGQFRSGQFRSE